MKLWPWRLYEPTTAATFFPTASRAHRSAPIGVSDSSQTTTFSSRPSMPPVSLTQRAYVCAIAGTPAIFTALMSSDLSGAQVITVTGSLDPPKPQGARHSRTAAPPPPPPR